MKHAPMPEPRDYPASVRLASFALFVGMWTGIGLAVWRTIGDPPKRLDWFAAHPVWSGVEIGALVLAVGIAIVAVLRR